jgi:Ca2+/H+ antiporter
MKSLFIFIGSFIITTILLTIPVLTALSFVYNWDNFFKFLLVVFAISEFALTTIYFWGTVKDREE